MANRLTYHHCTDSSTMACTYLRNINLFAMQLMKTRLFILCLSVHKIKRHLATHIHTIQHTYPLIFTKFDLNQFEFFRISSKLFIAHQIQSNKNTYLNINQLLWGISIGYDHKKISVILPHHGIAHLKVNLRQIKCEI